MYPTPSRQQPTTSSYLLLREILLLLPSSEESPCPKNFRARARRQEQRHLRSHEQVRRRSSDSARGTKTRYRHLISWVFSRWLRNERYLSAGRRRRIQRQSRGLRKRRLVFAQYRSRLRPCPQRLADLRPL